MRKYIQLIHCRFKEGMDSCRFDQRGKIKSAYGRRETRMHEVETEYKKIKDDLLSFKTIDDVLNYEINENTVKVEVNQNGIEEAPWVCVLKPSSCNEVIKKEADILQRKGIELKHMEEKLDLYKEMIKVLKKELRKVNDERFFKFELDKDGEITCTYFCYDEFEPSSINYIYLSQFKVIDPRSHITFSINDGGLKIGYINSYNEGINHGTFMLTFLIKIIPMLNIKIEEQNKEVYKSLPCTWEDFRESVLYQEKITHVYGTLGTTGMSEDEMNRLIRFYKRSNLYEDQTIYKELDKPTEINQIG